MGLDMFLTRKMYVKNWSGSGYEVQVTYKGKPVDINPKNVRRLARSLGIEPEGMYISNLLLQVHRQINQT